MIASTMSQQHPRAHEARRRILACGRLVRLAPAALQFPGRREAEAVPTGGTSPGQSAPERALQSARQANALHWWIADPLWLVIFVDS